MAYDPYSREVQLDPYPHYRWLRAQGPAYLVEEHNLWVLSRWAEVTRAASDPAFIVALGSSQFDPLPEEGTLPSYAQGLTTLDPPEHTRVRKVVQKVFGAKTVRPWLARIDEIAEGLVDDMLEANADGQADVATQLARPLPALAIADVMGLDRKDVPDLLQWSDECVGVLPGIAQVGMAVLETAMSAGAKLGAYCEALIAERQGSDGTDVVTALCQARDDDGVGLSHDELIGNLAALILGGMDTAGGLIGNGMVALLENPAQLKAMQADPGLIPNAVEEMLRFDAPAQGTFRSAASDIELDDTTIPAGGRIQVIWASANRDESLLADGEKFDITRKQPRHLALGVGPHFCIGAMLARVEVAAAFKALMNKTTSIELRAEPVVKTELFPVLRRRTQIPVTLS